VVIPEWTFGAALYHCRVTATTVGYGDMPNGTQAGRLLSCFHILVSVCLLGEIISTFDALKKRRQATMAKIKQLSRELDLDLYNQLIKRAVEMRPLVVRDGAGLTELEFVLAMLVELKVVRWDQVKPFIKRFRALDINGDARLGPADLELMKGKTVAELKALRDARPPEEMMTVEARMGPTTANQSARRSASSPTLAAAACDTATVGDGGHRRKMDSPGPEPDHRTDVESVGLRPSSVAAD